MRTLLRGHIEKINVVRFFPVSFPNVQVILSGSVDKTIRIWHSASVNSFKFTERGVLEGHNGSINCIAVAQGTDVFASGSADATIRLWHIDLSKDTLRAECFQTITTSPKFLPLTLSLCCLEKAENLVLAAAGTRGGVQIFTTSKDQDFSLQATLTGHEGWVRSLDIRQESGSTSGDLLLASASQDKYIRLWRIQKVPTEDAQRISLVGSAGGSFGHILQNKAHKIEFSDSVYTVSFEALLLGHEDWIYTVSWRAAAQGLQLLSASADSSLAIWEPEVASGVWICTTRLGEISAQKGSTTATGSSGGFWSGLWSPSGDVVVSLGRTGSWRMWQYHDNTKRWTQGLGISGHVKPVTDIAWAKRGAYLLSTGSDQTTRLHAEWTTKKSRSWHEFARPQIHGYDLSCADSIGPSQFISGADEKLLRVFDMPRATADVLNRLCGRHFAANDLPETANMPVLGLSNKAVEHSNNSEIGQTDGIEGTETLENLPFSASQEDDLDHPPFEDKLARHTLWPEREKLYGHGYEISAVATSHSGDIVATACKASSAEHAVIRLYATADWHEVKPSISFHTLTVTRLCFSQDDQYLLSVGRDRQWAIFEHGADFPGQYTIKHSNPKGHTRMILDATWGPLEAGRIFATAGRDKAVKLWSMNQGTVVNLSSITSHYPCTAVDVYPRAVRGLLLLSVGNENGDIMFYSLDLPGLEVQKQSKMDER